MPEEQRLARALDQAGDRHRPFKRAARRGRIAATPIGYHFGVDSQARVGERDRNGPSAERSRASLNALKRESTEAACSRALARQAHSAAEAHCPRTRSAAAHAEGRATAASKAARTRSPARTVS
jgi:hypothetical protein